MQIPYKGTKTLVTVKLVDLVKIFQNDPQIEIEVAKKWVNKYNDMFALVEKLHGQKTSPSYTQTSVDKIQPKKKRGRPAKNKIENTEEEKETIEYNEIE